MKQTPRILIVLSGSLGDIARGLFLVPLLRNAFPSASLHWLVEDRWQSIVALHPQIDRLVIFERRAGIRGFFRTLQELRAEHYDVTLDLQRNLKSGIFSFASGAARRIGFHPRNAREGNALFQTEHIPERPSNFSKAQQCLDFVRTLCGGDFGIEPGADTSARRPADSELRSGLEELDLKRECAALEQRHGAELPASPVGIVLGSSRANKDWPPAHHRELLALLSTHGVAESTQRVEFILLGDASCTELAAELLSPFPNRTTADLVGKTSLVELLAVLQRCRVVVGPDSGPAHLCAAIDVPYVGLYGPSDPARVAPLSVKHRVLQASLGCCPCEKKRCAGRGELCMHLLSAQDVYRALCEFLP